MRLPARLRGLSAPQWIAGASVLAALLVLVLTWQLTSGSACAATRAALGVAPTSGRATFYDLGGTIGNCSFTPPADDLYVALGPSEYDAAAPCGGFLDVTGPKGTVRVKVFDQCPECEPGHVDLSRTAFARIADPVAGIVDVRYRQVPDPRGQGRLSFQVKDGSSQFWLAILVDGAGNPLRSVEVRSGGGSFRALDQADFNYWIAEGGAGGGPFDVRVTDAEGNRVTATGIDLRPGAVQRTSARLYGAGAGGAAAAPTAKATRRATPTVPPSTEPAASATAAQPPTAATSAASSAAFRSTAAVTC